MNLYLYKKEGGWGGSETERNGGEREEACFSFNRMPANIE